MLPGGARVLSGEAVRGFPLVAAGRVDADGRLFVPAEGGIGSGRVKDTPWVVVKR